MSDPTLVAIASTFAAAFVIFGVAMFIRRRTGLGISSAVPEYIPQELESPYASPISVPVNEPPEILGGKIPTWFYRPLDLLGLGFLFILFSILAIANLLAPQEGLVIDEASLIGSIILQFVGVGIVTAFVITRIRPVAWLGLRWEKWPWIFVIAPGAVLGIWALLLVLKISGYMDWMEKFDAQSVQETVKLLQESKDPVVLGLMVVAAVFVAPFCEEIIFRGYLYSASKKFVGPWVAGVVSALIFSALHGNLTALLPLAIFGGLLAFIYEKTGSIWAPMAVHLCFNGATVFVQLGARYFNIPLDAVP